MKCIFWVPVRLKLCLDGSSFETNCKIDLNEWARKFVYCWKENRHNTKVPVNIEYKHEFNVKHDMNQSLSTFKPGILKGYLLHYNLKDAGTKEVIKRTNTWHENPFEPGNEHSLCCLIGNACIQTRAITSWKIIIAFFCHFYVCMLFKYIYGRLTQSQQFHVKF